MSWPTAPLASIAEVKLGRQRSPLNHTGPSMRKYLRAANVGWDGLILDDVKTMNFTDSEMTTFRLKPGDLLLNEASGSAKEVGKPALWNDEIEDCAFQNTLLRVRAHAEVDSKYLLHYFSHQAATGAFAHGSRGVGIHHLGREALSQWKIPLPPLDEQRRIAAILDHADTLRAKRHRVLADLDDLAQATFMDMFGDPTQAASTLDELAEVQIGPFGSLLHKEDYVDDGIPLVNPMHIVDSVIRPDMNYSITPSKATSLATYRLHTNDVVLGRRGEMGRCAVVAPSQDGFICGTGSLIVRPIPTRATASYLRAALSSISTVAYLERVALGSTLPNLNATIVKRMPVAAPPIADQKSFGNVISKVTAQRQRFERTHAELDALSASLQSRAFRGAL